jgi:hypothetical protein
MLLVITGAGASADSPLPRDGRRFAQPASPHPLLARE